jgi:quercetin dioxygenase-like cupin family protein
MKNFPEFMKTPENSIASASQSRGVKGWVYDGIDDKQMAYWVCETSGVSNEHVHDFDEYFVVLQGRFTLIVNNQKLVFRKGDEYLIPRNVPHAGEFMAGTRTIHCFGGRRAEREQSVRASSLRP